MTSNEDEHRSLFDDAEKLPVRNQNRHNKNHDPQSTLKYSKTSPKHENYLELHKSEDASIKQENPLAGLSIEELEMEAQKFCEIHKMLDQVDNFKRGAVLAADPSNADRVSGITPTERYFIAAESEHRWRQPWGYVLYRNRILYCCDCSRNVSKCSRGSRTFILINLELGAMGLPKTALLQGIINSTPYLFCAVFACWLNGPANKLLGRRGVIFWSCLIASVASIWESFTYSWPQLVASRLLLGLGIGPTSAAAPIYIAECAPASIRGSLVMQWETWTAFGVVLGDIVSVIFAEVKPDVAWRLMLGSTVVPPMIVCCLVSFVPESPLWYISKGWISDAYASMRSLRFCDLQASRDLFYTAKLLEIEKKKEQGKNSINLITDLWKVPRVRRAVQASSLVMLMQQFCGINVMAHYSSIIFLEAGYSETANKFLSMSFDIASWLFGIAAFYTIDTFGRRNLLLVAFPAMSVFLLLTGMAFYIPSDGVGSNTRLGVIATFIYLYMFSYGSGVGPVPFTYSAEAFPLYIRDLGMSLATAVSWLFNFVIVITFPLMLEAFKLQGTFGWYAGWCIIGWVAVFFTLPETKALTLEELDFVFSVPTAKHVSYQIKNLTHNLKRYILRQDVNPLPPLYQRGLF
uniref:Putative MFS sugar transporter n=1 Tax=Phakopsora pachyrhizi TaxID=170000 RepID=I6TU85_PHAPC|nr:putative MFS sugar transporter [Phakopsora pachyrhizi]